LKDVEFIKYVVAGLAAFAVDYSVLLAATELAGIHYLVSNVMGYCCGLLIAYTLNVRWVFKYRKFGHKRSLEFSIFVVIVIIGLVISESVIFLLVERAGLAYHLAKIVSVAAVFMFNFLAKKRFLFSMGNSL
jgi:putative flippase GtrA